MRARSLAPCRACNLQVRVGEPIAVAAHQVDALRVNGARGGCECPNKLATSLTSVGREMEPAEHAARGTLCGGGAR
eukprot:6470287-Prymnesium_polylepis.1